ncbi:ECF transporter S component [Desnuesiella massiliensis]|uniref:ECF transporter S component n=1 Tax=Desnuesiella massiliensis TaxID=1650662 RepID=UPI0006E38A07|nr:ECF transporter S component [Desnuesiella massiliensis]
MKKIIAFILVFMMILLIYINYSLKDYDRLSLVITLCLLFMLFLSYFYFEKGEMGTKEIALIATLSAFAAAARVPFAAIPNVQPTTFVVALAGYVFGCYEGFLVGATTAFISNIFLGQGPWTPWQMLGWGVVGIISGALRIRKKFLKAETFALICFAYGFLFDWIMNLWHIIGFVRPINLKTIGAAYLTGITFDILHATGNFIFAMIFYEKFLKIFLRFKNRLSVTYLK